MHHWDLHCSFPQFYCNFSYFLHCSKDIVIVLTVLADVCDWPKCSLTPVDFFLLFLVLNNPP